MDDNSNNNVQLTITDTPQLSPVVVSSSDINNNNNNDNIENDDDTFRWTVITILQALIVFIVAGIAEIGGGYLVWKAIRGSDDEFGTTTSITTIKKRWMYAILGSLILVLYGFIPTLQPTDSFGRIYAVYGGFFIVLSFLAGWYLDNDRPDLGDIIGGSIALVGVLVILFWPR